MSKEKFLRVLIGGAAGLVVLTFAAVAGHELVGETGESSNSRRRGSSFARTPSELCALPKGRLRSFSLTIACS